MKRFTWTPIKVAFAVTYLLSFVTLYLVLKP